MPSRREGSVTQRSKGAWQIRYYGPPNVDGKQKRLTETVRGLKSEAEKLLRERRSAIENGGYVPRDKETVSQFLTRWLDTYVSTSTTLGTSYGYRGYISRYIDRTIGSVALQSLTAAQIQGVYADMLDRGLSNTTVVQLHRILKEALSHAVKWGLLVRNVADATSPPKIQRQQMEMWDIPTIHRFLDLCQQSRFGDLYLFAVHTGLRRSEICGLKWAAVDLPAKRLSVVATLQRIKGHGLVEGQPKTGRSRRSVALSPEAIEALQSVRGVQIGQRLQAGPLWQDSGYVFTEADGSPVIPDKVTQDFARRIKKWEFPHLTLHGLRHAFASLLLTSGINLKVTSEMLGHSTIAVTGDIYSHVLPGLQEEAVLALSRRLAEGR